MLLDVSKALRAPGEEIAFTHRDEIPPQEIFGDTVTFDPVVMTGYYSMMDHNLRLRGRLQTIAHGECAGCFAPVDYEVDVPFDETFLRAWKTNLRRMMMNALPLRVPKWNLINWR